MCLFSFTLKLDVIFILLIFFFRLYLKNMFWSLIFLFKETNKISVPSQNLYLVGQVGDQ